MNITISNLKLLANNNHLGLSNSPFFIANNFFKFNVLQGIAINFFVSTFFYSSIGLFGNLSLIKSSFNHFLQVPILIQSKNTIVKIHDDLFKNCKKRAININEKSVHTIISNCVFDNCEISRNGGAIYSKCQIFECNFCCFYFCSTVFEGWWGSAIYVNEANESNITQISVLYCPSPQQERPDMDSQVSIFKGSVNCRFHNYTSGKHRFSSGIRLSHTKENSSVLRFITTSQHKSGNAISFVRIYFKGNFSHINFINNTCNLGIIYLYMADLSIFHSFFINNFGKINYDHADAKISLISCVFDKENDDIITNDFFETLNCTINKSHDLVPSFKYLCSCQR